MFCKPNSTHRHWACQIYELNHHRYEHILFGGQRKIEKKRKCVCVCVCVRARAHMHTVDLCWEWGKIPEPMPKHPEQQLFLQLPSA